MIEVESQVEHYFDPIHKPCVLMTFPTVSIQIIIIGLVEMQIRLHLFL